MLITLFSVSMMIGAFENPSIESTAKYLLLESDSFADFRKPDVKAKIEDIRVELEAVFSAALTQEGRNEFYGVPLFEAGTVVVKWKDSSLKQLDPLFNANEEIDLTKNPPEILKALTAEFGFTRVERKAWNPEIANIHFAEDLNPNLVVRKLKTTDLFEWAEVNGVWNNGSKVERFVSSPAVYLFNYGWGDCVAGCIDHHRFYYEAPHLNQEAQKIGDLGNPLPPEAQKIFKDLVKKSK